jgi:hypothetical protein
MLKKRRHERDNSPEIIHYAPSPYSPDEVLKGMMKYFSYSGLCIITHQALEAGQEIVVKNIITANARAAIVRWYQDLGNDTYKIVLEFKS